MASRGNPLPNFKPFFHPPTQSNVNFSPSNIQSPPFSSVTSPPLFQQQQSSNIYRSNRETDFDVHVFNNVPKFWEGSIFNNNLEVRIL